MSKVLFFDIDGTLMDMGFIPESTRVAINNAQLNGHKCIINTGRPYSTVPQIIKNFGFDGFVCGCGTFVKLNDEVIYHNKLSTEVRDEVLNMLMSAPVDMALEGSYASCFIPRVKSEEFMSCFEVFDRDFDLIEYKEGLDINYDKMTVFFNEGEDISALRKELSKYFDIIDRESIFIECQPINHSKASGIQRVLDYLDASIDDTISFGDSTNDLPMLKYTKESVAMGNSKKEIFDYVTYITDDLKDDGLYNAMKHFNLF